MASQTTMEYTSKSLSELKTICRERKIKGFSGKSSEDCNPGGFSPTAPIVYLSTM